MIQRDDPAFKSLTPRERKLLKLDRKGTAFSTSTEDLAKSLTKGMDQKKLERDIRKMERSEWE